MKGTITISHKGRIVQTKVFNSEFNKNNIIALWRKLYGKGFKNAELSEVIEEKPVKSRYEK